MKVVATFLLAGLTAGLLAGCSSSSPAAPEAGASATAANATPAGVAAAPATAAPRKPVIVPASAPPEKVVTTFLEAMKSGDEATTAALLTSKALEETRKHGIAVAPQSAPGAKYEVAPGEVLPENPNGAHVKSTWTEVYTDAQIQYEIVWVLRHQNDGWRIAGMALELIPGRPPQFLNFEDPQDMMKKQDEAIAAQEQAAAATAQAPGASTPPTQQR